MQHKLLHEASGQRTFVVVLETGDEVIASLQKFATRESVHAASPRSAPSATRSCSTLTGKRRTT
jgi:predicted DNA-binding protein with PD1-like motif